MNKKSILIIGTGGTIAGEGKEGVTGDYKSAQVKISNLVEKIPYIKSLANIKCIDMFETDSCDLKMDDLKYLSQQINEIAEKENFDGFVITHGTDTLEETAYFLNLTLNTKKPVVLTGSMRPGTAISADGPLNLYQAVALAANNESYGKGVLVTLSDGIYGARDVSKINTFRTQAFSQKDIGCLGYMHYEKPFFYNQSTKKHTYQTQFDISSISEIPKVEIVYFYIGADESILDAVSENSDGIVIAGAGCAGVSAEFTEKINKLMKKGFPVVRSSRIGNGLVSGGTEKVDENGIYSDNLNPQKARILLSLALTITNDPVEIQKMFNIY